MLARAAANSKRRVAVASRRYDWPKFGRWVVAIVLSHIFACYTAVLVGRAYESVVEVSGPAYPIRGFLHFAAAPYLVPMRFDDIFGKMFVGFPLATVRRAFLLY